ncbi:M13-type metalloendopeptidase [Paenibacillus sp. 481]|uniref:M13-type metalloendopeptidase n=1 Tax=Paenibacillus sp. 481 TaxID=2835869 RepID=UPI001E2916BB|nr:M13-type metalloendopeptidase [Paenibacillus sp. 481]UHA75415.1 S-layer homology domain-containing protein [Paenibacillus sp. 481]
MKKKFLSLLMATVMILSAGVPVYANDAPSLATRGQIVNTLSTAADAYPPDVKKEAIIQGYQDGKLREHEPAKKIEALVMLSRAFGELPKPTGNDLRVGTFDVKFTDVPAWAQKAIGNLAQAGLLTGKPDGTLGVNDPITLTEFHTLIARVWTLQGSHLNDDFYTTMNKKWLDQSTIPPGEMMNGSIFELHRLNTDKITAMIEGLAGKPFAAGTKERKLADFYAAALDAEQRNKQGIEPIRKYIAAIDGAKTLTELVQADLTIEKNIGRSTLFRFEIMGDFKNSNQNAIYFTGLKIGLDKDSYAADDATAKNAYVEQVAKYLVLTGEKESAAQARAEKVYELEKSLAAVSLERYEQGDVNKIYNPYTIAQFDELYKEVDMTQALKSMEVGHADKIIVIDTKLAQKGAELMTEVNLDVLKAYAKTQLLAETGLLLSDEVRDVANHFFAAIYGISGKKTDKELAISATRSAMSPYLEQMFAEKHFSAQAKKDVEQMVQTTIAAYEKRIQALAWMSEATKANAIKKLKAIHVKVGYPDKWDTTLDRVAIKTYKEGGSLFFNSYAATTAYMDEKKASLGKPVDKKKWTTSVDTVNALYSQQNNDITIPAGILQAPFYDVNAKLEQNLGAIGTLIGHEISHAFDNSGAAYDEQGNATNWWTEEDLKKFEEKCKKLIIFYDGIEIIPGVVSNGKNTLSENIADLGGMAAALEVVSELDNPDYKAFFASYAATEKTTATKPFAAMLSKAASHPASKVRVNRTIVNFPQFYEAYGIKPGDGMYVAPEDRVSIW